MAHRRGSFRRSVSQTQRRKKSWSQLVVVTGQSTARPGFVSSFGLEVTSPNSNGDGARDGFIAMGGDGSNVDPFTSVIPSESTILRIRGSLVFPKNSVVADVTGVNFDIGFGVTSITDNVSSSYPAPITDADWDGWMYKRQAAAAPLDANAAVLDVKAMRKIQDGEVFFIMAEGVTAGAVGSTGLWQMDLRMLILLP